MPLSLMIKLYMTSGWRTTRKKSYALRGKTIHKEKKISTCADFSTFFIRRENEYSIGFEAEIACKTKTKFVGLHILGCV